jgi:kynurenine 3-monooxygenase
MMLIALPNADSSFTATLFAPYQGVDGFNQVDANDSQAVLGYFHRHFPDVVPYMPNLVEDFLSNPIGSLVTVRTDPWSLGRIVLIGSAYVYLVHVIISIARFVNR